MDNKLKIQIWSDVMCPFCYIGKRKFEDALSQFENKDAVAIEWKSFQLDPTSNPKSGDNTIDHLAKKYNRDRDWSVAMHENVTQQAKAVGLDYHFENVILANSLNAHRVSHLAKKYNLGDAFEELLFKAYFTQGKDVNDIATLTDIGMEVGIKKAEIENVLNSDLYTNEVIRDQEEAQAIGVTGVPFFVFDNKYAVSGAQHPDTFLKTLEKAWEEGKFNSKIILQNATDANSCGIDGCE